MADEFGRYGLLVPPDSRLPGHWHISANGLTVSPLPDYGTVKLDLPIHRWWMALPDELKANPEYSIDNHYR